MSTALSMPTRRASDAEIQLSGQEKAAIIVRLLLNEGADFSLQDLSGDHQIDLVHQMADMSHIDEATVASVVEEILGEFPETGLSFPVALEDSLEMMAYTISPETSRNIGAKLA